VTTKSWSTRVHALIYTGVVPIVYTFYYLWSCILSTELHLFLLSRLYILEILRLQPGMFESREGQPTQEAGECSSRLELWKLPRLWYLDFRWGGWTDVRQDTRSKRVYYRDYHSIFPILHYLTSISQSTIHITTPSSSILYFFTVIIRTSKPTFDSCRILNDTT
jgi:hypothetical protein